MLSIVFPAYNEEARIPSTLADYRETLAHVPHELIVVCDGTDGTADIAERAGARVLRFPRRLGKGGAVLEGFKSATGSLVGFVDADGSTPAGQFLRLAGALEAGSADGVVGSRKVEGADIRVPAPASRRVASFLFGVLVSVLFHLGIRDTQCGAKLFRREPLQRVLPLLRTRGFEFDVELLWRLKRSGGVVREVPLEWRWSPGSRLRFHQTVRMGLSLVRLRFSG
ncbi:MAG: glycosyltransferase family 2 protein [Euryarchaeota archaeon]|nr:glycosyltransferase family 2 protein [Euryarchaeota archaeon]